MGNTIRYRYCVDVISNNWRGEGEQHKTATEFYERDSKYCFDEVLEEANAWFTGDVTCRINGIYILENDVIVGFLDPIYPPRILQSSPNL